ncbi:20277_t:CDS:2 [Gigaspora rosea]|nr:20277_t:CDS:2 [Gigaspora rosea]
MKELEKSTSYQESDSLTGKEMKLIFNHSQLSQDNLRGFYIEKFAPLRIPTALVKKSLFTHSVNTNLMNAGVDVQAVNNIKKPVEAYNMYRLQNEQRIKIAKVVVPPDTNISILHLFIQLTFYFTRIMKQMLPRKQ